MKIWKTIGFVVLCMAALADYSKADTSIYVHGLSKHVSKQSFNEVNPGLGIAYNSFEVGTYYNSESTQGYYGQYNYRVYKDKLGLAIGAVNGYSMGKVVPYVVPYVKIGRVRAMIIPLPVTTIGISLELN